MIQVNCNHHIKKDLECKMQKLVMKVKNTDTGDTAVNALILTTSELLIEWLIDF